MAKTTYTDKAFSILQVLNVAKMYYIDDQLEQSTIPSREDISSFLSGPLEAHHKADLTSIIPDIIWTAPSNVVAGSITRFIDSLEASEENNGELLSRIGAVFCWEPTPKTNKQSAFLVANFGKKLDVICMGPVEWAGKEKEVLTEAHAEHRIMCLFDQNLNDSGNTLQSGVDKGTTLISQIISKDTHNNVYCVLLSGEVSIATEFDDWLKYTKSATIPSSKFFPLSKERTSSPKLFAEGIQLSSLNALYDLLKANTFEVIKNASNDTQDKINSIHVYNLNYIVANSRKAKTEGVWQASTLLRLYNINQQESIDYRIGTEHYAEEFNKNIKKVRTINELIQLTVPPSADRFDLRHLELYEGQDNLNNSHAEIKIGNIFRAHFDAMTSSQDYVLIAQPCDLMVRGNSGRRRATVVSLAPISVIQKADYENQSTEYLKTCFELEHYTKGSDDIGLVEFSNVFSVEINVLDLAVLNAQGRCILSLTNALSCPAQLHTAWELRFGELTKDFNEVIGKMKQIDELSSAQQDDVMRNLVLTLRPNPYTSVSNSKSLKMPQIHYSATSINYGLQRVGNIRQPLSNYLLDAYTKYLSRTAYEHDFSL